MGRLIQILSGLKLARNLQQCLHKERWFLGLGFIFHQNNLPFQIRSDAVSEASPTHPK